MFDIIKHLASLAFGVSANSTAGNAAGALITHSVAIPALIYLGTHYAQTVNLPIPLWCLAVFLLIGYVALERFRRGLPGGP